VLRQGCGGRPGAVEVSRVDERRYERLAAEALGRVLDMFEAIDPDDADVEPAGDVVRIDFRGGARVVLNTQRPARQLWLAGGTAAWHFSYDEATGRWMDDKGRGDELFATLARLAHEAAGLELEQP
jgi:CyaY protein